MRSYLPAFDYYKDKLKLHSEGYRFADMSFEQETTQIMTVQEPAGNAAVAEVTYELRMVNGTVIKQELSRVLKDEESDEKAEVEHIDYEQSEERRANHKMKLQPAGYPKIG